METVLTALFVLGFLLVIVGIWFLAGGAIAAIVAGISLVLFFGHMLMS